MDLLRDLDRRRLYFLLIVFAAVFAAVYNKVSDSDSSAPQTTTLPR